MEDNEKFCAWENRLKDSHILGYENSLWEDTGLFCRFFIHNKRHHADTKKMKSLEISRHEENGLMGHCDRDGVKRTKK